MTPFQILAVTGLGTLLAWEVWSLFRGGSSSTVQWLRIVIWAAAAAAIVQPGWLQALAERLGVHRAADLVLYVFVLAFLSTSFFLYAQNIKLRRELTELVRRLAIRDARPPQREG
jgi:small membrane protein